MAAMVAGVTMEIVETTSFAAIIYIVCVGCYGHIVEIVLGQLVDVLF